MKAKKVLTDCLEVVRYWTYLAQYKSEVFALGLLWKYGPTSRIRKWAKSKCLRAQTFHGIFMGANDLLLKLGP